MIMTIMEDGNDRSSTPRRHHQSAGVSFPPVFRVLLCYVVAATVQFAYLSSSSSSSESNGVSNREQLDDQIAVLRRHTTNVSVVTKSFGPSQFGDRVSLDEVTQARSTSCPPGLVFIENVVASKEVSTAAGEATEASTYAVPRIVHQTSKSRCVTPAVADAVSKWKFANWSYFLYDDEAIMRLFRSEFRSFPLLEMVADKCMLQGAIKADVFRYLVLYRYGGIYADIDAVPRNFTPDAFLHERIDSLFVIEQYHLLSQYFMAVSPRHPLMWYAIQHSLINLLQVPDTGRASAPMVTGPHALHFAFMSFRTDVGAHVDPPTKGYKPVQAGTYIGTDNRSVTAIGRAEDQNQFVDRDVLRWRKKREYEKMDMTHFQDDKKRPTHRSCLASLYGLSTMDTDIT